MLPRVLEPEVMDSAEEARDYDAMDHSTVNRVFVADFLAAWRSPRRGRILDCGTGTAQIPIEFCRQSREGRIVAVDAARHMLEVAQAHGQGDDALAHVGADKLARDVLVILGGLDGVFRALGIADLCAGPARRDRRRQAQA